MRVVTALQARSNRTLRLTGVGGILAIAVLLVTLLGSSGGAAAGTSDPADLSLTKSDSPDPITQNAVLTYTIEVGNAGPDAATNVMVSDDLPGGIDFVSATATSGTCDRHGGKVDCNLGTLANAASATVTIKVNTKNKSGSLSNTASVTSDVDDPQTANNSDTEGTTILEGPSCANKTATIVGTVGDDTIAGTSKGDVIVALEGNDSIFSGGGRDRVCAGSGQDLVKAGGDADLVRGGGDSDRILGRGGGDELRGNRGDDRLRGNRGPDLLAGGRDFDRCRGGAGRDILRSCEG